MSTHAGLTGGGVAGHLRVMDKAPAPRDKSREERLAKALRENLRKRKAQARDAQAPPARSP